ncbi:MAG: c-type cytochrome [Methylococcus sp.]|nr:c-type cytochrome [Methylococcus sp.]
MHRLAVWALLAMAAPSIYPLPGLAAGGMSSMSMDGMDMQGMDMDGMMEGSSDEGAKLAESLCAPCHGSQGVSASETHPNLAGQDRMYLASALQAYKCGARNAPLMNQVAAKLSEQDIGNLTAYFAGLSPRPACPMRGG